MKLHDIQDKIKEIGNALVYTNGLRAYLPNIYAIESNNNIALRRGWGIILGDGALDVENSSRVSKVRNRVFTLVFTAQNIGNPETDAMIYGNDQELTEDGFSLVDALISNKDLNSLVTSIDYSSDGGIEIIGGENGKEYMQFSLNVNVIYKDYVNQTC